MNLEFLGDAFDHWKGSLFESLCREQVLRDFRADPMITDSNPWSEEDQEVYARLLRIRRDKIIQHSATLKERANYFDEISHQGDLFLDPDTGIATGPVKHLQSYLIPSEIGRLLDASANRLLVVYQHVRGQLVGHRVDQVMKTLQCEIGGFRGCSYESGTVAMLFLARSPARTAQVEEHFATLLGRHAAGRIRRIEVR